MSTRNLSRKEEVRNASVAYNEKIGKLLVIGGDSILSEEEYREINKNPSFIAGAEWADKTMIDKVCEWLKENMSNYIIEHPFFPAGSSVTVEEDKMVEDFRKAMEGEL